MADPLARARARLEQYDTTRGPYMLGETIEDVRAALAEVDRLLATLAAIHAALGNGADEAAWPPGMTAAEAVGRLRAVAAAARRLALDDYMPWDTAGGADDCAHGRSVPCRECDRAIVLGDVAARIEVARG